MRSDRAPFARARSEFGAVRARTRSDRALSGAAVKKWLASEKVREATRPIDRGALGPRRSEPVRAAPRSDTRPELRRSDLVRAALSDGTNSRGKSPRSPSRSDLVRARSERLVAGAGPSPSCSDLSPSSFKRCGPSRIPPLCIFGARRAHRANPGGGRLWRLASLAPLSLRLLALACLYLRG